MPSPTPTTNPCAEVILWNGNQIQLTPVAVRHLRTGDLLYGRNSLGDIFRRQVLASSPGLTNNWYICLDLHVRPTSVFPLPRVERSRDFYLDPNMIVLAHLGLRHATG